MTSIHIPVLAAEVVELLAPRSGAILADGTLGGGGHTALLLEKLGADGHVIALDRDAAACEAARQRFAGLPVSVVHASYERLPSVLAQFQISAVDGVLLDLGLSSDQLAAERGFSFSAGGSLDMRFDTTSGSPAWEWLADVTEEELADAIYTFGEERASRAIARRIVQERVQTPILTSEQLAEIIRRSVPRSRDQSIDPATRTFQAIRIAVNDELGALHRTLWNLPGICKLRGRAAIISFHSLEDRLVKDAFRADPRWKPLTKKPVVAGSAEVAVNPRSRSAKLRVAERVLGCDVRKLVSGGQTGVDRGALDAAIALNLAHGGWCPRGRLAEDGMIPPQYQLLETESTQYHIRTERNIRESDGTLIVFRGKMSGGTSLTFRMAVDRRKPFLMVDLNRFDWNPPPLSLGKRKEDAQSSGNSERHNVRTILTWLAASRIAVLNVAGPRESGEPGIQAETARLVMALFGPGSW
jgi:16S rRNA (cytosine1402-N4)-methyltransferase